MADTGQSPYGIVPPAFDTEEDARAFADWIMGFRCRPLDAALAWWPWGEGPLKGRKLEDWQFEVLQGLQNELQADEEKELAAEAAGGIFNKVYRVARASGHGIGKMEWVENIVPTPDGYRRWGDIQPGDLLFGKDGSPTRVTGRYDHKAKPLYRVTFDDGSYSIVGPEHNWSVRGRNDRRKGDGWQVMTTAEIMAVGIRRPNGKVTARQWEIPRQGPAQYPERELPIDPYVLGVWLGDGDSGDGRVCIGTDDADIFERVRTAYEVGDNVDRRKTASGWRAETRTVYGLRVKLRALGLLGNKAAGIPAEYMTASVEQRTALLNGIMDTDGGVGGSGNTVAEIGMVHEKLVIDTVELARSLGHKARMGTEKAAWYRDEDGNKVMRRTLYRARITKGDGEIFWTKRKREALNATTKPRYLSRWIDRIEEDCTGDAMCVTVDAPDSLYLTSQYVVTHNTAFVAMVVHWFVSCHPDSEAIITASTDNQLSTKTWRELRKWQLMAINGWMFEWTATRYKHRGRPETWFAAAIPWSDSNPSAFQGTHERYVLVLFDESSGIAPIIWESIEGAFSTGKCFFFALGNPVEPNGGFFDCFNSLRHRWNAKQLDSRDVSFANLDQINAWIEDYGEDSDFVRIRVKGEFPKSASNQFIDHERVAVAALRNIDWRDIPRSVPRVMGVDVSRQGKDSNVIVMRQGRKMMPRIHRFRTRDLMEVVSTVMREAREQRPDLIFVDGVGLGAGVVDRLVQLGMSNVVEVQSGSKEGMDEREKKIHANLRAIMWSRMREWLSSADIPNDKELKADLVGPTYGYQKRTNLELIEDKDSMRARGLPSPDSADALALTFAETMPSRPGYSGSREPDAT